MYEAFEFAVVITRQACLECYDTRAHELRACLLYNNIAHANMYVINTLFNGAS